MDRVSRHTAIRDMFKTVEGKYGSFQSLARKRGNMPPVLTTPTLTRESLEALFSHKVCAVRVPNFYPIDAAEAMAERLRLGPGVRNWMVSSSRGMESSDVQSTGIPYNVALSEGPDGVRRSVQYNCFVTCFLPHRNLRHAGISKIAFPTCGVCASL